MNKLNKMDNQVDKMNVTMAKDDDLQIEDLNNTVIAKTSTTNDDIMNFMMNMKTFMEKATASTNRKLDERLNIVDDKLDVVDKTIEEIKKQDM